MANRGLEATLSTPPGASAKRRRSGLSAVALRIAGLRNRLVQNPRFQRWAARFPLTRPVARRKSAALFDLCAGFVYSQTLAACVSLDLFERLRDGPQDVEALARTLALSPARLRTLIKAAAALELLELDLDDRARLGMLGAALLGNPGVRDMIAHHGGLYADLADPVALLSGSAGGARLSGFWPYATADAPEAINASEAAPYTELMAASQALVAEDILSAWRFDRHRHVLDLGGGNARFAETLARGAPDTRITVFDLPGVIAHADRRLAATGLAERIDTRAGDFFRDPLPRGADLVTLIRILHDHDDDKALALLKRVRAILPANGRVLVAEPMSGAGGAARSGDAYFGLYLMAMGSGRPRSMDETCAMLRTAGFRPKPLKTVRPLLAQAVVGMPVT